VAQNEGANPPRTRRFEEVTLDVFDIMIQTKVVQAAVAPGKRRIAGPTVNEPRGLVRDSRRQTGREKGAFFDTPLGNTDRLHTVDEDFTVPDVGKAQQPAQSPSGASRTHDEP
jgi:hypothetical protein